MSSVAKVNGQSVMIRAEDGGHRVVLLPTLWVKLLCTAHASIFTCHLRIPQTYAGISAVYWWPDMQAHESESEGSDPSASHSGWDAGNRWAIDVAGPLSVAENDNRYVVAAVVETVADHTTSAIAKFKVEKLVLAYRSMRELVIDGPTDDCDDVQVFTVRAGGALPQNMDGSEVQNDLDWCVNCAVFAYNGAQHPGTGYNLNELMVGASCVPSSELLRESEVTHVGRFAEYHRWNRWCLRRRGKGCASKGPNTQVERLAKTRGRAHCLRAGKDDGAVGADG
ncbi:LOW QUALITY PROTEIN: Cyclic AMP-dependent protein kinase [Phytophthora megakarya]|uniref:Cyclic AMP-dependent protein kinase n=1 Tax=Phytophthora megakarya TaxID=4795 RepID=A0A225W610_9STRA|nr:LOW QUALITY PROTEIN: Cyclic AMP-dependent protein kinase [Phytophthora megakarya]